VVWSYAGVRPLLYDDATDPAATTRDYLLDLDAAAAPLLSVYGGKITTFRRLAEEAVDLLCGALRERYARAYGSRALRLLGEARRLQDLGEEVLPQLFAAEIDYLRREEWAQIAEDLLWRRSKLGLHLPPDAAARLDEWLARHPLATTSM